MIPLQTQANNGNRQMKTHHRKVILTQPTYPGETYTSLRYYESKHRSFWEEFLHTTKNEVNSFNTAFQEMLLKALHICI